MYYVTYNLPDDDGFEVPVETAEVECDEHVGNAIKALADEHDFRNANFDIWHFAHRGATIPMFDSDDDLSSIGSQLGLYDGPFFVLVNAVSDEVIVAETVADLSSECVAHAIPITIRPAD